MTKLTEADIPTKQEIAQAATFLRESIHLLSITPTETTEMLNSLDRIEFNLKSYVNFKLQELKALAVLHTPIAGGYSDSEEN